MPPARQGSLLPAGAGGTDHAGAVMPSGQGYASLQLGLTGGSTLGFRCVCWRSLHARTVLKTRVWGQRLEVRPTQLSRQLVSRAPARGLWRGRRVCWG